MFNSCLSLFGGNEIAQYIKEKKEMVESLGKNIYNHEYKSKYVLMINFYLSIFLLIVYSELL
jgi:hypothetical protein